MPTNRWIKLIVTVLVSVLLVSVASPAPVEAMTTVITVPGGDVVALYAAVYENGMPRNNVEINLEPGVYVLDPSKPFGGRLVLGENTTLRSTFEMAVDANDVPAVDENNEPIVLVKGAKIDGSKLPSQPLGESEGIIIVRDHGLVERLWVDGGASLGIVITFNGTARKVASTRHLIGFQVEDVGSGTYATLEGNLAAGNLIIGIGLVSNEPAFHPTGTNAEVYGNVHHNASVNNGLVNFFVAGGVGATTDSEIAVDASHNVFRGATVLANVRIVGGQNAFPFSGSNNNQVKVNLVNNIIADTEKGLTVEGGTLIARPLSLEERQSSNNEVIVNISGNTFENNIIDIRVIGSWSRTGESGGDNNMAKVVIKDGDSTTLTIDFHDCYPEDAFPICNSEAKVTFIDN